MSDEATPVEEPSSDYELQQVLAAMRRDGSLIREKARVLTEDGLAELYRRMQDGELSTSTFLDVMKYLAEVGDLKPKQHNTPQSGPGFSITINIPQEKTEPITLEAVPDEEAPLKDIPVHQLGLTFDNSDLTGGSDV
jgi:hypothetical protein